MQIIKKLFLALTRKERRDFLIVLVIFLLSSISVLAMTIEAKSEIAPIAGGSFHEGIIGQPTFINPIISGNQTDHDLSALIFDRLSNLATSYEPDKDNRVFTVKLKEDLVWDDNEPLTSDDVIYTINAIQNPENHSPLFKNWQGVEAERVSELQVKFTLPTSYVFFKNNLERLPIIPKHIFDKIPLDNIGLSTFSLRPVGDGPYKFESFKTRRDGFITEYRFVRNDLYHGSKPYIQDFYFNFYSSEKELFAAFRQREIGGFGELLPLRDKIGKTSNAVVEKMPMARYYGVFMNPIANSILKDINLRKALIAATPREKIITEVMSGEVTTVTSPLVKNLVNVGSSSVENDNYNPATAKDLIKKVVLPKGTTEINLTLIVPQIDFLEKTAEILKQEWLAIGINRVNIIALNPDDLVDRVIKTREYDLVLFGNVLENPIDLFPFWHSSQRFYPGLNLSMYQNFDVDKTIETIRKTTDENTRNGLIIKAQNLITNDAPAIFLFSLPYYYVHNERLEGVDSPLIAMSADRFKNITDWNVLRARVFKK
ncbi:MAG: ABC transporter substrate-binding protein [Patescibacteria group bacterium]